MYLDLTNHYYTKRAREKFNIGEEFAVMDITKYDKGLGHIFVAVKFKNNNSEEVVVILREDKKDPQNGEIWRLNGRLGVVVDDYLTIYYRDAPGYSYPLSKYRDQMEFVSPPRKEGVFKVGDIVKMWGVTCTVGQEEVNYKHPKGGGENAIIVYEGIVDIDKMPLFNRSYTLAKKESLKLTIPVEIR